jgi:hypothetical protein
MTLYHQLTAYDVRVSLPNGESAYHVVVTYNFDAAQKFVGVEFFRLVWTTDDSQIAVGPSGVYNFREELRLLNRGVATYSGPRANETKVIEAKMKEAYDAIANVTIRPHQAKP